MAAMAEDLIQLHLESPREPDGPVNIDDLAEERGKDLLRFSTAGSVDDGKSTLIGRLLYDTQSVYEDQIRSIEGKGTTAPGTLDLALLTDGLRAEREQGITIDVAYRYFATARRKFIIADTPGHEQYTRNMATGASTADVAIVLIDARKGVLTQSRRHAYITSLLGVRQIIIAVNKMDLVAYSKTVFEAIRSEFTAFYTSTAAAQRRDPAGSHLYFVPVSALAGDNVVHRTDAMPWYEGPSLLELLETVPAAEVSADAPFRMSVQRVIRPHLDFRGFAGQIASGVVRPGDELMVLPSRRTSRVRSIVTFDGELAEAPAPLSVTLTFEDELDISRGDLLVAADAPATTTSRFTASLVWMDERPLQVSRRYLLKHASRTLTAYVSELQHRVNITTLEEEAGGSLSMNGIGVVEIQTLQPLSIDVYADNRITGSFVLIDTETNATVAAGMIRDVLSLAGGTVELPVQGPVRAEERRSRWHHAGAHVGLSGTELFAQAVERALFERGVFVVRVDDADASAVPLLTAAGAIALTLRPSSDGALGVHLGEHAIVADPTGADLPAAVSAALALLVEAGVVDRVQEADRR